MSIQIRQGDFSSRLARVGLDVPSFFLTILALSFDLYLGVNPATQALGNLLAQITVTGLILLIVIKLAHPEEIIPHRRFDQYVGQYGAFFDAFIIIGTPALIFILNVAAASIYVKNTIFNIITDNSIYFVLFNAGVGETLLFQGAFLQLQVWITHDLLGFPVIGKTTPVNAAINALFATLFHTIVYQAQTAILLYVFEAFFVLNMLLLLTGNLWLVMVSHINVDILPQTAKFFGHLILLQTKHILFSLWSLLR